MEKMKNINVLLSICCIAIVLFSCNNKPQEENKVEEYNITNPNTANGEADMDALPVFYIENPEYNFGTVIQGEKVAHTFVFKNTGQSNLVISNVKASCGCTTPKWSREPIKPGKEGTIEVIFDSAGRSGEQSKTVKVYCNTQPNVIELRVRCQVETN
jgi:hypothetical protein